MPDETPVVPAPATETPATPTNQSPATPPAVAIPTETPAETMIPKSRFDEVNNKLKAIELESSKAAKAAADAETKRLQEEGKYKELFEKQQADLLTAQAQAREASLKVLQRDAATQTSLPAALADRLKGETIDELVADAKSILAALPKPAAPNINANAGPGGAPQPGQMSDAEKLELANRLGVNPKYM